MHTTFTCTSGFEAVGTTFFYEHQGNTWLVTAAHNLTARHALTGAELGCLPTDRPDKLTLSYCVDELDDERGGLLGFRTATVPLYDCDGSGRWVHHPDGQRVDIAALQIDRIPSGWKQRSVNDPLLPGLRPFAVTAGTGAVILGFPLTGEPRLPFWKAATVASEPAVCGSKHIWVDSSSRPGMSGGPVFARHSGWLSDLEDKSDGGWGDFYHFIGVYTGRVDNDPMAAQIGRVFRRSVIDEMLDANIHWTEHSGF